MTFLTEGIDESLTFPDGQPHISVRPGIGSISCRITTPTDLLRLGMLADVMRLNKPSIRIRYLLGDRMDRRLSDAEPYTLKVVCDIINSFGFPNVSVFCPHSKTTSDLLHGFTPDTLEEDCFFDMAIMQSLSHITGESLDENSRYNMRLRDDVTIVFPDEGAGKRFSKSQLLKWWASVSLVTMSKDRDERTGKINGIGIYKGTPTGHCVIVDDLCDGGATFVAASKVLRERGAKTVSLAVCHGVFSKGIKLEGIDFISTTNSYKERESEPGLWVLQLK